MRRLVTATAIALAATGCVSLNEFDPVGGAATIEGSWTIDGAPPTMASCNALGASRVRVTFLDDRRPVPHAGLIFSCAARQPDAPETGTFDTREAVGGTGPVVAGGTPEEPAHWDIRLDAVDGAGAVVATGPVTEVSVVDDPEGGFSHIVLPPAAFSTSTISAFLEVDGQPPNVARCDAVGVAEVRLVFDARSELDVSEACAAGAVGARVASGETYTVRVEMRDAMGTLVGVTDPETFDVGPGDRCVVGAGCDDALPSPPPAINLANL